MKNSCPQRCWTRDSVDERRRIGRGARHLTLYVVGEHHDLLDAWQAMTHWWDGDVPRATLLGVSDLGHQNQLVEIDARIVRA